jgi:hypothetical protein|uniref:Uncharacterized protein n=1 Tax=Bionectria ochroleuca TaxID=29856 RepID=A0A8H7KE46_BIOOC
MSTEAGVVGSKPPEKKKREQSNTPSCPVPGSPPKGAPPRSPLRADAPTSEEVASSIDNPTRSREMLSRKGSWAMAMTCLGERFALRRAPTNILRRPMSHSGSALDPVRRLVPVGDRT